MMTRNEILTWVKEELIHKRLKLEDMGVDISEIKDDTQIFAEDDLGLDSVDGLELAIGIQQKFQVTLPLEGNESFAEHFQTPTTITNFIITLLTEQKGWKE